MVLETSGSEDFKTIVKSLDATDIVTVSEGITSMANRSAFVADEKTVASVTVAEVLPTHAIPDAYTLIIIGKPNNTDEVYYGQSKAEAETKKHALPAKGIILLKIDNSNPVWILPKVSGEGIDLLV